MSKKRFPKIYKAQLTPRGSFKFPKLNTPDTYNGDTKYKVALLVSEDDPGVQEWIAKLTRIRDEEVEQVKKDLIDAGKKGLANKVSTREVYKMDLDKEGEETGMLSFDASMKAEIKDRTTGLMKPLKPKFFDSKGKPIKSAPPIWGGTIGRLGVDVFGSKRPADGAIGVTLRLDAVFLIDVKNGGARDASAYGFQGEDDGYSYEETDEGGYDMSNDADSGDGAEDNDDF